MVKKAPIKKSARRKPKLVTKDMTIGEVVQRYPVAAEIMLARGLHCIGCHINPFESIEQGALGHGMGRGEIDGMVDEINASLGKKKRK